MNERIVEIRRLLAFLDGKNVRSVLDIGAYGANYHGIFLQLGIPRVIGSDLRGDPYTRCTEYVVGDATTTPLPAADLVTCISTIEHPGVSVLKGGEQSPMALRRELLEVVGNRAARHFYLTFPFGQSGINPGHYENIDSRELAGWCGLLSDEWEMEEEFWHIVDPAKLYAWRRVPIAEAREVPLRLDCGVMCVGLLMGTRRRDD